MQTTAVTRSSRTRTCEDEGCAFLCLEHVLAVCQHILEERCEPGVPVVLAWHVHGPQHILVDVDRTCSSGNKKRAKAVASKDRSCSSQGFLLFWPGMNIVHSTQSHM
jgi:hypothetical protein